jgi:hypothetical protein
MNLPSPVYWSGLSFFGLNMPICRVNSLPALFCATSLMRTKLAANSWRRMAVRDRSSARVLDECIAIRLGATLALFIRHLARLSSDRMGSFSPSLAAGKLQQHRNRIPPGKMDVPNRDCSAHLTVCCGAICPRLSRAASASDKGSALMGPGDDARVRSIPRAANHTYGAEDTR